MTICSDFGAQKNKVSHCFHCLPIYFPWSVWITINCGKFWKRWKYQTTWSVSWEACMQVRKQQLELDMQKRHWCIEQSFGLCGRGRGWDDLGEWHWNMYNIIYETSHQSRFNAWYWMLGACALGRPRGMIRGGRREGGSGWVTRVYPWRIHVDVWQTNTIL